MFGMRDLLLGLPRPHLHDCVMCWARLVDAGIVQDSLDSDKQDLIDVLSFCSTSTFNSYKTSPAQGFTRTCATAVYKLLAKQTDRYIRKIYIRDHDITRKSRT